MYKRQPFAEATAFFLGGLGILAVLSGLLDLLFRLVIGFHDLFISTAYPSLRFRLTGGQSGGSPSLGLAVQGVLTAEPAILVHFQPVGIVLLVFHGVVVALLAFRAGQGDFDSHNGTSDSSRKSGMI